MSAKRDRQPIWLWNYWWPVPWFMWPWVGLFVLPIVVWLLHDVIGLDW